MFLFKRTLLVAALIAASLVATSVATSAWATPNHERLYHNHELRHLTEAEQRDILNRVIAEEFPHEAVEPMQAIARCESQGLRHIEPNGTIMHNASGAFRGALQVAWRVHQRSIDRLAEDEGVRVFDNLRDYVRFTLILYNQDQARGGSGFRPWPACSRRAARHLQQAERARRTNTQVAEARP